MNAGLCGGRTYALLEKFLRQACSLHGDATPPGSLYETMNRLAASVPPGSEGLRCNPLFTGTRSQPELRGTLEGISVDNFTPAHVTRALLEGMARVFAGGARAIEAVAGKTRRQLVGGGKRTSGEPRAGRLRGPRIRVAAGRSLPPGRSGVWRHYCGRRTRGDRRSSGSRPVDSV